MRIKIAVILLVLLATAGCGNNECREESKRPMDDHTRFYEEVCIGGHVYYQRSIGYQGYLSIKLDDNGKPVKCY
jgi:hypothetical protein